MKGIKEYLYVMDYSDGSISRIDLDEEESEMETIDILDKYGFDENTCSFMITTNEISEINIID